MDHTSENQQTKRPSEAEDPQNLISDLQCPSVDKKRSRRGGRRPGAGAPKGNLNGLKHGRRSKQVAALGMYIAANPRMRAMLLHFAGREGDLRERVDRLAQRTFANILQKGIRVGKEQEQELNDIIEDMLQ